MKILIYGIIVGATMLVPGVSGGTMAMILGIYDELIARIQRLTKDNIIYISLFVVGGLIGILLLSKIVLMIYELYYLNMIYFFIGIILASSIFLFKELKIKRIKFMHIIYIIVGIVFILLFNQLPTISLNSDFITLFLCGILLSIALILPGISVSYVLLILGLYKEVIIALTSFKLLILFPLMIGLIIGIILVSKIMDYCLKTYKIQTYMIILGFVLASIFMLIPSLPSITSLLLMFIGFIVFYVINKVIM